jgi:uncharacterized protein YsxB (DUF464 family)
MIKFSYNNKDQVQTLQVTGHANNNKYGLDIVCSSVSSIIISHLNLIERLNLKQDLEIKLGEGLLDLKVNKSSQLLNTILINIIESLEDLTKQYPKNIGGGRQNV